MNKRQLIIKTIIKSKGGFTVKSIRKSINLSRSPKKGLSTNYIYRVINALKAREVVFVQSEKRNKKANNYPIKIYFLNLSLINKLK